MVESVPIPPSSNRNIRVAAEQAAAGTSDNTDTTHMPEIVVPFNEDIWDGPVAQEHVVDQPETVQPTINVLLNAPRIFHPVENLTLYHKVEPVAQVEDIP